MLHALMYALHRVAHTRSCKGPLSPTSRLNASKVLLSIALMLNTDTNHRYLFPLPARRHRKRRMGEAEEHRERPFGIKYTIVTEP